MDASNRSIWSAILLGGLIAGTIDIGSAALIYWVNPILILHAIASGILGRASFYDGPPAAILGLFLQWAMSLIIAAIFILACRVVPALLQRWVQSGLAYGVLIFFVMNYGVVPLSAARPQHTLPHFTPARFGENMLAMLLFGFIVAFFARRVAVASAPAPRTV